MFGQALLKDYIVSILTADGYENILPVMDWQIMLSHLLRQISMVEYGSVPAMALVVLRHQMAISITIMQDMGCNAMSSQKEPLLYLIVATSYSEEWVVSPYLIRRISL